MDRARLGISAEWRLVLAGLVIACALTAMAVFGAMSSWRYYLTVDECLGGGPSLVGQRVRVSGVVAPASLERGHGGTGASFRLRGDRGELAVACGGAIPDNLAEGRPVVVEGRLEGGTRLTGDRVMTRCASKYEAADEAQRARVAAAAGGSRR